MSAAELMAESRRRDENRRAGRPLDWVDPAILAAEQLERDAEAQRNDRILEAREQQVITNVARAMGFRVRSTSQYRAAKISPDFPDLWLSMEAIGFAGWWETKRQVGGARTSGQVEFGEECLAARIPYGFGDRYEFASWLARRGFSVPPIPQD